MVELNVKKFLELGWLCSTVTKCLSSILEPKCGFNCQYALWEHLPEVCLRWAHRHNAILGLQTQNLLGCMATD